MSLFSKLARSRSVPLHLTLWALAILLAVSCATTAPQKMFRWLVTKCASDHPKKQPQPRQRHDALVQSSDSSGNIKKCTVLERFIGGAVSVSKCDVDSKQAADWTTVHYELHMRIPNWRWFELLMTPRQFVGLFESWAMVAGSVALVFVVFLAYFSS